MGNHPALQALITSIVTSIGYKSHTPITSLNKMVIMWVVLALIDVVMISNLLIMVIVGDYKNICESFGFERSP